MDTTIIVWMLLAEDRGLVVDVVNTVLDLPVP
jgi:hypothetical protein